VSSICTKQLFELVQSHDASNSSGSSECSMKRCAGGTTIAFVVKSPWPPMPWHDHRLSIIADPGSCILAPSAARTPIFAVQPIKDTHLQSPQKLKNTTQTQKPQQETSVPPVPRHEHRLHCSSPLWPSHLTAALAAHHLNTPRNHQK
jgi:hypothetical protein